MTPLRQALDFLRTQLGAAAPAALEQVAEFVGQPLEREGAMTVFAFTADIGGAGESRYYVVAGETEPNYYPVWNLRPHEIYAVHLGTRFMLVLTIAQCPPDERPEDLDGKTRAFIESVAPGQAITDVSLAAAFRVDDQTHAVYRLCIDAEPVYVFGADCPPGIYRQADLPPRVAYRLHLGNLILAEAGQPDAD